MVLEIAPRIVVDAKVRFGKPVIQGTRVPVELVLNKLAAGMSEPEICQEFGLSLEDIRSVLAYAASVLATEEVRATA